MNLLILFYLEFSLLLCIIWGPFKVPPYVVLLQLRIVLIERLPNYDYMKRSMRTNRNATTLHSEVLSTSWIINIICIIMHRNVSATILSSGKIIVITLRHVKVDHSNAVQKKIIFIHLVSSERLKIIHLFTLCMSSEFLFAIQILISFDIFYCVVEDFFKVF